MNSVVNFNGCALYHSAAVGVVFRVVRLDSCTSWLWWAAWATDDKMICMKFSHFKTFHSKKNWNKNTYIRFEKRKFAPHRISSHLVLSVTSSPTWNSLFSDCDQHFPGCSGWTPDSPAIHTARSAHSNDEIHNKLMNAKQNFIFYVLIFTVTTLRLIILTARYLCLMQEITTVLRCLHTQSRWSCIQVA